MQIGLRHLQATALMRDYRAQGIFFENVDMSLDERSMLRQPNLSLIILLAAVWDSRV